MKSLLCVALILTSSAASAQLAPGQSGSSSLHTFNGSVAWDTLIFFSNCYVSSERSKALQLVSTPAGSLEEAKTYKKLFSKPDQGCLGDVSALSVPWQFVRGSVAESFYRKKIPVPAELAVTTPMLPENTKNLSDIATCFVGRNTADARQLVEMTYPGSKQESQAVTNIMPQMAECLPPNLPKAPQFDTMLIRFRVAEALWKLGMVATDSAIRTAR